MRERTRRYKSYVSDSEYKRLLAARLAMFREQFWKGERWMLIQVRAGENAFCFFRDYIDAETHANRDAKRCEALGIMTISRAIKITLWQKYGVGIAGGLERFEVLLATYPAVSVILSREETAGLLSLGEFIPVYWSYEYYPLSCCIRYDIIEERKQKRKILGQYHGFAAAMKQFNRLVEAEIRRGPTGSTVLLLIGEMSQNSGVESSEICFYRAEVTGGEGDSPEEVVQLQDPTSSVLVRAVYFVRFDQVHDSVIFYDSKLRKQLPGAVSQVYPIERFLKKSVSHFDLAAAPLFGK